MLQCLSNTAPLTEYFTENHFISDVNTVNPIGHGGVVAHAYANLLKDMWSGKYSVCAPSEFKRTIGKFYPQFSGYDQQDSQEFARY